MNKILIIFAHPLYEKSRVHKTLVKGIPESVRFHDLYEAYPDFNIDIKYEQNLLLEHDIIIWQHPFYWYSVPPLVKQWIDMVLQFGWAYGKGGEALKGKIVFNAISTGGSAEVYSAEGRNKFTIREFLIPIEQTARLCHLNYLPPFVVHGTHSLTEDQMKEYSENYRRLLTLLESEPLNNENYTAVKYLNDLVK
jgi:glutathione-regulated potassium-efflux system ancillary protein KefG